jgi:Domain of unknown function (DUF4192)
MPNTTAPPDRFRVRDPGDLIEFIPYLLGFHPRSSLVLVGLDGVQVAVTARVDLADVASGHVHLLETVAVISRSGTDRLIACIYDDGARIDTAGPVTGVDIVQRVGEQAAAAGVDLVDALLVARGRWWSYICRNERCCPNAGRPLSGDSSPAAAVATYAGLIALPERADVAAVLQARPDADRRALEPLLAEEQNRATAADLDGLGARHQRSVKRALFAAARDSDRALFPGAAGVVTDAEVCRYAVGLGDLAVRDAVWLAGERRVIDGRPLWLDIARRVPEPYDAPPLFLFGWLSWRDGNGTLATLAAERALSSDPRYSAAELLIGAVSHGLDPRRTPRLRPPRSA